jgi:hypothetical protein
MAPAVVELDELELAAAVCSQPALLLV